MGRRLYPRQRALHLGLHRIVSAGIGTVGRPQRRLVGERRQRRLPLPPGAAQQGVELGRRRGPLEHQADGDLRVGPHPREGRGGRAVLEKVGDGLVGVPEDPGVRRQRRRGHRLVLLGGVLTRAVGIEKGRIVDDRGHDGAAPRVIPVSAAPAHDQCVLTAISQDSRSRRRRPGVRGNDDARASAQTKPPSGLGVCTAKL